MIPPTQHPWVIKGPGMMGFEMATLIQNEWANHVEISVLGL